MKEKNDSFCSQSENVLLFNTEKDKCLPSDYVGDYHIHILCLEGVAHFGMGNKVFRIGPNDWAIWQIGSEIYDTYYSSNFNADFLLISKTFLIENNPETIWATKGYVYIKQHPVFHLKSEDKKVFETNFVRFRELLSNHEHLFRWEMLGKQTQLFIYDLWNIYAAEINRCEQLSNTSAGLFQRFMDLVRQYASVNREVSYYADKLCVTPKYLSEVVNKSSGKPASYWIAGYALQEIIIQLRNPDVTLADISTQMLFYNPSHFCRFVKRMLGVSPSEYRNELEKKRKQ